MVAPIPLRRLFPVAAVQLTTAPGLWAIELDPRTAEGIRSLYNTILFLENTSQKGGLDALVHTARALRGDLLALAEQLPPPIANADLHALLLATTLGPARAAVISGRVNVAYEWLLWSLTTTWEIDDEHTMHIEWPLSAAQSRVDNAADEITRPWLLTLYQYDWLTAGLPGMTRALARFTLTLAVQDLALDRFDLAAALLGWAGNRRVDPAVAAELRWIGGFLGTLADNPDLAPSIRFEALKPLALCLGTITGQDQKQRSRQLLHQFGSDLNSTDKLGVLGNVLTDEPHEIASQIDAFIELALDHHAQFDHGPEKAHGMAWMRGTMHSLLDVPLRTLLLDGQVDLAMRLLRAWRGLTDHVGSGTQPLIAMLAGPNGVSWVTEGGTIHEKDTGVDLADFQVAANAFLGNTVTVTTEPEMALDVGDRGRGVPDEALAPQFQQTVETFLNLEAAQRARADARTPPSSLLLLPTLQAPVQALMTRHLGWTLPLWMSLHQPAPDRPIRNALLYLGGSLFSPIEEEILTSSLSAAGVQLTVRTEAEMARARFVDDYNSNEFDLIWVGTHGVFDGLQPDDAYLHLSETERVTLDDLRPPTSQTRRLLVLNACDGAVTAQTGGVGEIGLAAAAAASTQAVISHQWPIESATTALMFAGVLANSLTTEPSFFESYQTTMTLLGGDLAVLRDHVSKSSERLARLVEDNPDDFARLTGWASATFVE